MANFGNAIINLRTADNKAIVGGAVGLFTKSFGQLLYHGLGIPAKIGAVFGGLWVSAFALTTLDTSNRLARYAFQEIVESFRGFLGGVVDVLQNRWVGSLVAALLGFYFIKYGGAAYTALWAGFAGTNQLLASIAMLTAANWVKRVQKASGATLAMVFLPAVFLWVTVFSALVWYLFKVVPVQAAAIKGILGAFVVLMLILSVILLVNFWTTLNKEYKPSEEMA
ncbi:MAG: carbon starvation CstA 5TM domain-containing protein, partial [candidate division WOR-3 bacterium]